MRFYYSHALHLLLSTLLFDKISTEEGLQYNKGLHNNNKKKKKREWKYNAKRQKDFSSKYITTSILENEKNFTINLRLERSRNVSVHGLPSFV